MGYQITLFLTLMVYLDVVSDSVPIPSDMSTVPIIVVLFMVIIVILAFTIS